MVVIVVWRQRKCERWLGRCVKPVVHDEATVANGYAASAHCATFVANVTMRADWLVVLVALTALAAARSRFLPAITASGSPYEVRA